MVLDASLLYTQHYKVRIKGKVVQPREGVAPSPTPWCSTYRKGSLRVTLDYGSQLYFTTIYSYKEDLALNNLLGLICYKIPKTNQPTNQPDQYLQYKKIQMRGSFVYRNKLIL